MKINTENTEKINKALKAPQKKCSARLFDAIDIQRKVKSIESFLGDRLYKKDWVGLEFTIYSAGGTYPSSYRGRPECTVAKLVRGSTAWFMTYCGRCYQPMSTQTIVPKNIESKTVEIIKYMQHSYKI